VLTLAGDFTKGALVVWATRRLNHQELLTTLALVFVVAGHIWPFSFGFGRQSVVTSLGHSACTTCRWPFCSR